MVFYDIVIIHKRSLALCLVIIYIIIKRLSDKILQYVSHTSCVSNGAHLPGNAGDGGLQRWQGNPHHIFR